MTKIKGDVPSGAVAGLSEILRSLGDELREANHQVGEYSLGDKKGTKEPILFLTSATVELAVTVSASANGGVKVWVVNAEAGAEYERSGKVTVDLNPGGQVVAMGQ